MSKKLRATILIFFLVMFMFQSCTTKAPTPIIKENSQPEQLKLVDGTLDACLLLQTVEVENALGLKVKTMPTPFKGATSCKYVTSDGQQQTVLMIIIYTDTTLQKADMKYDAGVWFEQMKKINSEIPLIEMQDVSDLGDQAYSKKGSLNSVDILKNRIYFNFTSREKEVGGFVPMDTLIGLAKVAMERAP